ncbi:MAG TPA: phosphatidylserine/phosphatidylglycerophosphate/cardiolipin synthase family protein [Actinomycetales bacterium]|nr:phosphatidylserine/phosphatidylglycerophosphate/cardiolipin synthase family protein [Actinomycetales bacterium]
MSDPVFTRARFRGLTRRLVGAAVGIPLAAAAGVVAVDRIRVHRDPPTGKFPRAAPAEVTAAGGNRCDVYTDGSRLYEAMLADIRTAQESIYFETFIWKGDSTGKAFKKELEDAAARGVEVFAVYDSFANIVVPRSFKRFSPDMNVIAFPILTPGNPFAIRTYAKDHRKILVVDEQIGYVGGYNIGRLYADSWRDTHLRLEGPAVWELTNAFTDLWNSYRKPSHPELPDRGARAWEPRIRALQNLPDRMLFPVRGSYIDAIERAATSIKITQAYFLPDDTFIKAMLSAVERGVEVQLLIPENSNHVVADWAGRAVVSRLLRGGVRIHLFRHAMIHAKTMTVDGRWTTLGTTNIDRLSFTGNFEVNLEVYDEDLAHAMEETFARDLTNSRELTLEEWDRRGPVERMVERAVRPLAPLL